MRISIEEFFKTGKFGELEIGSTKENALAVLGEPNSDTDLGGAGSILLYGWYELFFNHEGKLQSIQNDHYNPANPASYTFKNEKIQIDSWFLIGPETQSIADVSGFLAHTGIDYEVRSEATRSVIRLQSGVLIDFDEEEHQSGIQALVGFRYWP